MNARMRKKTEVVCLTGPQHKAVMALAAGDLKQDAAARAGVRPATISAWLGRPDFVTALEALRSELATHATLQLRAMTGPAIFSLSEILENGPPPARLRAAMYILDRLAADEVVQDDKNLNPERDLNTQRVLEAMGFAK